MPQIPPVVLEQDHLLFRLRAEVSWTSLQACVLESGKGGTREVKFKDRSHQLPQILVSGSFDRRQTCKLSEITPALTCPRTKKTWTQTSSLLIIQ